MADAVTILRAAGLGHADLIVRACGEIGFDVAGGAAMVKKETGGRSIWGHDKVATGGPGGAQPGTPVTRENYGVYKARLATGKAGAQGCSDSQLTWPPLQRQADAEGGCWDPLTNIRVGCRHLRDLIRSKGEQAGAKAYNGTNAAAAAYGRDWVVQRNELRRRLQGSTVPAPPRTPAGGPSSLERGDPDRAAVRRWQDFCNRMYDRFRPPLTVDGDFGDATERRTREIQSFLGIGVDGKVGPQTRARTGFRG